MSNGNRDAVTVELTRRIAALDARGRTTQFAADLDAIRRISVMHGFGAMTPVIHALEAALGRGERGPHVSSGLSLLHDAVHCPADSRSIAALAAACSLRVAG